MEGEGARVEQGIGHRKQDSHIPLAVELGREPQMGDGSLTPGDHVEERDTEEGDGEAEREEGTGAGPFEHPVVG